MWEGFRNQKLKSHWPILKWLPVLWPSFELQWGKSTPSSHWTAEFCVRHFQGVWLPHYLIRAPVPQSKDAQTKDEPWPRQISSDGISEDVKGITPRSVAFWINLNIPIGDIGWNCFHVLPHESIIPSYFRKCWKIESKNSNKVFNTEISNRARECKEKNLPNMGIKNPEFHTAASISIAPCGICGWTSQFNSSDLLTKSHENKGSHYHDKCL